MNGWNLFKLANKVYTVFTPSHIAARRNNRRIVKQLRVAAKQRNRWLVKQRKELENRDISIISSNCVGG